MESPEILSSCTSRSTSEIDDGQGLGKSDNSPKSSSKDNLVELQEQVIANLQKKPNLPNVNVQERIVICLDICYDVENALYRMRDGTSFTPINMSKRILDFFIHSKHLINKRTEFALLILKDFTAVWIHDFTDSIKDIIHSIDSIAPEASVTEQFDFAQVYEILKEKVEIPPYIQESSILPPPYVVRVIVLYNRSNCLPLISQEDEYFIYLKKQLYFYIDILYCHEEDCALYKCEEVFDTLQDLDNGYSYVYEASKSGEQILQSMAKLLAHPLQRPLQKNTNYTFGSRHTSTS